jgi:hypothetical protein
VTAGVAAVDPGGGDGEADDGEGAMVGVPAVGEPTGEVAGDAGIELTGGLELGVSDGDGDGVGEWLADGDATGVSWTAGNGTTAVFASAAFMKAAHIFAGSVPP